MDIRTLRRRRPCSSRLLRWRQQARMPDSGFRCRRWRTARAPHPNASVDWSQFEPLVGIPAVDPNDVTPYAEHWMASVERQFGAASLVTVSYVGASSHHLLVLGRSKPSRSGALPQHGLGLRAIQRAGSAHRLRSGIRQRRTAAHDCECKLQRARSDVQPSVAWTRFACELYKWSKSIDQSAGLPEPVNPD